MTPAQCWTEIFSVIKGSHNSCEYAGKGLPKDKYVSAVYRKSILDQSEKDILESFKALTIVALLFISCW